MNTRLLFGIFLGTLALPGIAAALDGFVVNDFSSNITILSDGTVQVVEMIEVDFQDELHGIYRDIPLTYEAADGSTHYSSVAIEHITDGTSEYEYRVDANDANMRIRIGDPDRRISGTHRYELTYLVSGILVRFDAYDELYWNVTGNDWEVPIQRSSAYVFVAADIIQVACYQGSRGSKETCSKAGSDKGEAFFEVDRALQPGEGFTIAVGYPKGVIPILTVEGPPPFEWDRFVRQFAAALGGLLVIGGGFLIWLWWKFGRDRYFARKNLHDPDAKERDMPLGAGETIVVEYDAPEKLHPAEIGLLIDEKADTLDISATIVDLAVRGYFTITEIPKTWIFGSVDYVLTATGKSPADLLSYEQTLYRKLFEGREKVALSDLKETFYLSLTTAKNELYELGVEKGFFVKNPQKVRTAYRIFGVLIAIAGAAAIFFSVSAGRDPSGWLLGAGIGLGIDGIALAILASYMPRRTAKGRELYRQARGYKLFVSGTEKYRQPFFEKQNIFMEVLPYAMVFGVTSQLANAMKEMGIQPTTPAWYAGAVPFNIVNFTDSMNSLQTSLSSAMASAPSGSGSGGGGFSGGGFGGGGGGGW